MQAVVNKLTHNTEKSDADNNIKLLASDLIFPTSHHDGPRIRYGYVISTMNFLVPEGVVCELLQKPVIYSLPNTPSYIAGLINIRGNIIPVMDIEKLLRIKSTSKINNILIFNKFDNANALALVIKGLPVLLEHSDNSVNAENHPDIIKDYINTGFSQTNADWVEFDPQVLFINLAEKHSNEKATY